MIQLFRKINSSMAALVLLSSGLAQGQTPKKPVVPAEPKISSPFFPDWGTPSFSFGVGPIIGARMRQTDVAGVRYDTLTSEIGLGARVRGIPLVPGNPGISAEPYASFTWGQRSEKAKGVTLSETENSGFNRSWYGVVGLFYYKFFRYTLDLGLGRINYDKNFFVDIESQRMMNDFGILILPFLSAHYSLTLFNVREAPESRPSIEELDHWLHARVAFSLLDFHVDVGPGLTVTQYSGRSAADSPFKHIASSQVSYLKALAAVHLFWKLGANGAAKYIIEGKQQDGVTNSIDQLPNQGLNQTKSLAPLPNGSLEASAFFGVSNLFSGMGIGWQFYYLQLPIDGQQQITRNQGLALTYETDL